VSWELFWDRPSRDEEQLKESIKFEYN
jgi:hypothetical protein